MAEDPDAIDWPAWSKTRFSVPIDGLKRYNLARVDPYTVQIAQTLCEQFKFSNQGQRDLAHAFGSLPESEYRGIIGMGYGPRHLVPTILKSDPGFVFLSICGVLCEYFSEDVVVAVFMDLMEQSSIPPDMAPVDIQWKGLVQVCYGVLATSHFGVIVNRFTEYGRGPGTHADVQTIAQSLKTMNNLATGRDKSATISAGADVPWFAAVAQWLFDLKFVISGQESRQLFTSPGIQGAENAQLVLDVGTSTPNISQETSTVTGGRVVWETLFRSCFGSAFQHLDKDILACTVANTSAMIHHAIVSDQHADSRIFFLQQASDVRGLGGHGLNETVMAWFPELHRLSPRIEKWASLSWEEARDKFDQNMKVLESSCTCSSCGDGASSTTSPPAEICKLSMVEVIVSLGLFIARMIVVPQLYPKRSGVLSFYNRHHAARLAHKPTRPTRASDDFINTFAAALPTPFQMIHTACILFSGSAPLDSSECLNLTHAGLCISLTTLKALTDDPNVSSKASVLVSSGNMQYQGRLIPGAIADKGIIGLGYSELAELARTTPKAVRQIGKLRGGETLLLSLIWVNRGQEAEAEAQGWTLM